MKNVSVKLLSRRRRTDRRSESFSIHREECPNKNSCGSDSGLVQLAAPSRALCSRLTESALAVSKTCNASSSKHKLNGMSCLISSNTLASVEASPWKNARL